MDVQADRSRLLNRQKKDRNEVEKDVKKKKGAMKVSAQKVLDDLIEAQERELVLFDEKTLPAPVEAKVEIKKLPAIDTSAPLEVEWSDLSKKELEEECVRRGLSRGGKREELVTRLIGWAAEMRTVGYVPTSPKAKKDSDSEDEEHSSDNDSVSGSDTESIPDMNDTQKLEAEKQYKREVIVRKAIIHLFEAKFHEGFPLDDLSANLEKIKVMNFKVESLGYTTLHEFARKQPREAIFYDKGIKWLKPVHLRSEKRSAGHSSSNRQ